MGAAGRHVRWRCRRVRLGPAFLLGSSLTSQQKDRAVALTCSSFAGMSSNGNRTFPADFQNESGDGSKKLAIEVPLCALQSLSISSEAGLMPRGGYRKPENPAAVSGPGAQQEEPTVSSPSLLPPAVTTGGKGIGRDAERRHSRSRGQPRAQAGPVFDTSGVVPLSAPDASGRTPR